MNSRSILVLAAILLVAGVVSAFAWYRHHQRQYQLVNVGGEKNQCECSKRIER